MAGRGRFVLPESRELPKGVAFMFRIIVERSAEKGLKRIATGARPKLEISDGSQHACHE